MSTHTQQQHANLQDTLKSVPVLQSASTRYHEATRFHDWCESALLGPNSQPAIIRGLHSRAGSDPTLTQLKDY